MYIYTHTHTVDTDVIGLQVGLEVLGARLGDRIHCRDEHRTVLSHVAVLADVSRDVSVAAHHVTVFTGDAPTRLHASVQGSTDGDQLTRLTPGHVSLVSAVVLHGIFENK
jgi:hypothetical protein